MTVDHLSGGRLMLGVGVGWMVEEFDAVGIDYEERNRRTEECIQIYKASWTGDLATFEGNYYSFRDVSQDPKPVQQSPHPPIVFGGNTIRGARARRASATGSIRSSSIPMSRPAASPTCRTRCAASWRRRAAARRTS